MIVPACDLPEFDGQTVLIAEPNPLIALDLAETLSGWGARPLLYHELDAPAQLAAPAMVQAALIDVPQFHQPLSGLIGELRRHGVPTVLTTAYGSEFIVGHFSGLAIFDKPVDYAALARWFRVAAQPPALGRTACTR